MSEVIEQSIKVVVLSKVGKYKDDWVKIYVEPNNAYSECGGRITVNIGDDHIGSHFFSHCGTKTFEHFLGKVSSDYLINKLFQTDQDIDVESSEELLQSLIENNMLHYVKTARISEEVSKEELRELYEAIKDLGFRDIGELSNMLDSDAYKTMSNIFGEDWFYERSFKKNNHIYERQACAIQSVINHFKDEVTV